MKRPFNLKILAAFLFLLIAYWPISGFQFAMKYDIMDWFYPMRYLIGECLQNNVLPVWNPYTNLGYPLHTDPQSGALYPIVWIIGYFLGYSPFTINLEFILHILFAFYGMKKLSDAIGLSDDVSILVGLSYACCGFFVGNAQHLTWIISAAWIPYILYYYYKLINENLWKDAVGLSLFCFLLLTGGYPAFTITTFYILLIAFFVHSVTQIRRKEYQKVKLFLFNNCIFFLLFVLQGLAFFVFFAEVLPFMVRADSISLAEAQLLPFTLQSFISFVLPFATGGNAAFYETDISMSNGYFGLMGVLFSGLCLLVQRDRKTMILAFVGLFFLLVSMGDFSFLRAWLYHYVPMMNLFRYPSLFRVFAMLCFLLLFGFSLQKYWNNEADDLDWKRMKIATSVLLVSMVGIFLYALQKGSFLFPDEFSAKAISTFINQSTNSQMLLIQAPVQIVFLTGLLIIIQKRGRHFIKYLALIIVMDLFLSVQLNLFITAVSDKSAVELEEKTNQLPKGFPIPKENISSISHSGNGDFYPIWYNTNILLKKIANDGYNNFLLKNFKQFNDSPGKNKKLDFLLLHWAGLQDSITSAENTIEIEAFNPTKLKANVSLTENRQIIFLQSDYPGWQVKLDGQTILHSRKENIFIAADIPKGNHEVEFSFYPKNYLLYLGISGSAVLFSLFVLIGYRKP